MSKKSKAKKFPLKISVSATVGSPTQNPSSTSGAVFTAWPFANQAEPKSTDLNPRATSAASVSTAAARSFQSKCSKRMFDLYSIFAESIKLDVHTKGRILEIDMADMADLALVGLPFKEVFNSSLASVNGMNYKALEFIFRRYYVMSIVVLDSNVLHIVSYSPTLAKNKRKLKILSAGGIRKRLIQVVGPMTEVQAQEAPEAQSEKEGREVYDVLDAQAELPPKILSNV